MPETTLVIDGHVHIYDCYDLEKFFDSAIVNLNKAYLSINSVDNNFHRILLLAESKDNDYFSQFKKNGNLGYHSKYKFENTEEECSLILLKSDQPQCYILKGRQIVTKEKLEVLSIASDKKIADGLPIEDVVKKLLDNQMITVLAWGVGKWFFKRGQIIKNIIEKYHSPYLFIGDTSSRPSFWPIPKLYNLAECCNIGILRGSDPLSFSGESGRVGRFGFIIEGNFKPNKPAASLCNLLISDKRNIKLIGYQDSTFSFIKRQTKALFL